MFLVWRYFKKVPRTSLSLMTLNKMIVIEKNPFLTVAAVFHKSSVPYVCAYVWQRQTLNLKRKTFIMLQCYLYCIRAGNGHSCAIHLHVYIDKEHCKLTLQFDFS